MEWLGIPRFLLVFYILFILSTSEYFVRNFYSSIVYFGFAYSVSRSTLEFFFTRILKEGGKGSRQAYLIRENYIEHEIAADVHKLTEESKLDKLTTKMRGHFTSKVKERKLFDNGQIIN